jgi:hypothetical protein
MTPGCPNLQVISGPLLGIAKHLVGGADFFELFYDSRVGVNVRVVFARQGVEGLLNFLPGSVPIDA